MAKIAEIDTLPEDVKPALANEKNAFGFRVPRQDELVPVEGYEQTASPPVPDERDALTTTTDTLKSFAKGAGSLVKGLGWLANSKTLEEVGRSAEEYWASAQSDYLKSKIANVERADGFIGTLSAYIDNPAALADAIVQSIPMMIPGMGTGAIGARAASAIAYRLALRAGAAKTVAAQAAQKAALRTAMATNIAGEGAVSGGATGSDVETFAKAKGAADDRARAMANEAALKAGLWTAAGALLGAGAESRAMLGTLKDKGVTGFSKTVAKEAGEEMVQNPGEDFAAYEQKVKLDPSQKFDPGKSIAEGLATGGLMGAGFHVAGRMGARADDAATDHASAAEQPTTQRGAPNTLNESHPVAPDVEHSVADMMGQAEPATPVQMSLEAPDLRMQNRDRGTASSVVQMQSIANAPDFDRLNASPIADVGAPLVSVKDNVDGALSSEDIGSGGEITLPDGSKVPFRYAVVDAGAILTSHDAVGRANKDYANPQPGQLVALTNGRAIGLREAYARGTATAPGGYFDRLLQAGEQFGISRDAIANKAAPVLVRLYDDAINKRPDIGKLSNSGGSMRMSAQEVARNDALILPDISNLVTTETGDIDTPANQPFIRGFVQALPETERAEVLDRDGRLSQVGLRRIRNAIIHRAYGESSVFGRLVESLDSGMANLSKSLMRAAPKVAKVKELMAAGAARNMDITATLVRAVAELEKMRAEGMSLAQFLAQARLIDQLPPDLIEVMSFLDANIRSPNRIAAFIESYYQHVEALGDPRTEDMFGAPEVSAGKLLSLAANQAALQEEGNGDEKSVASSGTGGAGSAGTASGAGGIEGGTTAQGVSGADQSGAEHGQQSESAASGGRSDQEGVSSAKRLRAKPRDVARNIVDELKAAKKKKRGEKATASDSAVAENAGAPQDGMQERPSVRADESGSMEEPAQSGIEAGGKNQHSGIPRAVQESMLKAARKEQERLNAIDLQDEIDRVRASGNVDLSSLAGNPKYWDAENEELTEAGLAEADRLTEQQAIDNLSLPQINDLSDLDGAHQFAQAYAMEKLLDGLGVPYHVNYSFSTSRYIQIHRGDDQQDFLIRFADHSTTARGQQTPDVNVAPGANTFSDAIRAVMDIAGRIDADSKKAQHGQVPSPNAEPRKNTQEQDERERALADLAEGIDELVSLLGGKLNMLPEEEERFLPIMSKIFRAAAKLGYIEFKAAGKFVLEQIRAKSRAVADKLTIDNLQAGYINIAREIGGDKKAALAVESIDELMGDVTEQSAIGTGQVTSPSQPKNEPAADASDRVEPVAQAESVASKQDQPDATSDAGTEQKPQSINDAAHEAATSQKNDMPQPSTSQKDAGNYKKGHIRLHGLDITIENPDGSQRSNYDTEAVKALYDEVRQTVFGPKSGQSARLLEQANSMASDGDYYAARAGLYEAAVAARRSSFSKLSEKIRALADKTWVATMPEGVHYGYIKRTEGADGDHVDVFVGPRHDSPVYWIINQRHPDASLSPGDGKGDFDEHKVMLGFLRMQDAVKAYLQSFEGKFGDQVYMSVSPMKPISELAEELPLLKKAQPVPEATQNPARRALRTRAAQIPSAESAAVAQALAPENRAKLYEALAGKDISIDVQIMDTGKAAIFEMDASQALKQADERVDSLTKLLDCVRG